MFETCIPQYRRRPHRSFPRSSHCPHYSRKCVTPRSPTLLLPRRLDDLPGSWRWMNNLSKWNCEASLCSLPILHLGPAHQKQLSQLGMLQRASCPVQSVVALQPHRFGPPPPHTGQREGQLESLIHPELLDKHVQVTPMFTCGTIVPSAEVTVCVFR